MALSEKLIASISKFIEEYYVDDLISYNLESEYEFLPMEAPIRESSRSLEDVVRQLDETFSQRLLRWIDEKNMTDTQIYKRANIKKRFILKISKMKR